MSIRRFARLNLQDPTRAAALVLGAYTAALLANVMFSYGAIV